MEAPIGRQYTAASVTTTPLAPPRLPRDVLFALCVALLANSILRGIRTPGGWPATGLLINYDFGFSRRALLGAIVSWIDAPMLYSYAFGFWFSVAIFSANIFLLLRLLTRIFIDGSTDSKLSAVVFASSFSIVMLAHCIGCPEQIALLITLISLKINGFYTRAVFVSTLFPACLLIHETALVMFFPIIFFRFVLDLVARPERSKVYVMSALGVVIPLLGLAIGMFRLDKPAALNMYLALQSKADFPLRPDEFVWLMRGAQDTLRWSLRAYHYPFVWKLLVCSLVVTLPSALYFVLRSVRLLKDGGHIIVIRAAAAGAAMSPLLLNFVGAADTPRYSSMGITASFLIYATILLHFRAGMDRQALTTKKQHPWAPPAILVLLNLGSTIPLFDYYALQSFPYEAHIDSLTKMATGQDPFPPKPVSDWYPTPSVIGDYNGE